MNTRSPQALPGHGRAAKRRRRPGDGDQDFCIVRHVHLKDFRGEGRANGYCPVGQGR